MKMSFKLIIFAVLLGLWQSAIGAKLEIDVEGIDGKLRENVLALLSVKRLQGSDQINAFRLRQYFSKAHSEISTALEPFGYYHPDIQAELKQEGEDWVARFRIDPGAPVRIHAMDLRILGEGNDDDALQQAVKQAGLSKGDIAVHARYDTVKKSLQNRAVEAGYLDAEYLRHELRIDPRTNEAEVILYLETGQRYRFGEVSFNDAGLSHTLLQKYVPFEPGKPYSGRKLLDLQRALLDSDYFESVSVKGDREAAHNRIIPIEVQLTPRKRHKYTAGIGFGTDTGLRGRLGWEHRRINRQGHTMSAELKASEIYKGATLKYSLPVRNPRTDRLSFTAASLHENTDATESDSRSVAASLARARGNLRETLSLEFLDEEYSIGNQEGRTTLLMPGVAWVYIKADSTLVPEHGHRLQLELRGAADQLLSDTSFVQAIAAAKYILPVGSRGRLLTRGEAGTTWMSAFDELPASVRFFAGGDRSVRGYDYNSLGPKDESDHVIGGRHLLTGSVEYEHRVKGNWRGAVFIDTGNAFDGFGDGLNTGVGVGVRWVSPIGMVRIDVAAAVSEPGNPLRLHVTLGPDL